MLYQDELLQLFRETDSRPMRVNELMGVLQLPRGDRSALRRSLARLVEKGLIVKSKGRRYSLRRSSRTVTGRLEVNPRGFGFISPERSPDGLSGDIYVAAGDMNAAVQGDRVVARLQDRDGTGRARGIVLRIVERSVSRIVGRLALSATGRAFVTPFDRRFTADIAIEGPVETDVKHGEMVEVELKQLRALQESPTGKVVEVLGNEDAAGVDTTIVLRMHGISEEMDSNAMEEAFRLGSEVKEEDFEGRSDFRTLDTLTIDGDDARDFDDAISLGRTPSGNNWLGVHIADVAHYVAELGPLDRMAYERGTSVYFPDRAVHMFPAGLATGLCSLKPNQDRLVQTCFMEIDDGGNVVRFEFHDGVIHSDARMTYQDVNSILNDRDTEVLTRHLRFVPMLKRMEELFRTLHGRRHRRGAIEFELPQAEFRMNESGGIDAIAPSVRNTAHRIVEEFMLAANETVASYLENRKAPGLFRNHARPELLSVSEFESFINTLGHSLMVSPESAEPVHFQRLIERLKGTPEERPISLLMLRSMQQARYESKNSGHFGLASDSYTHFTSPIRRYPDLVVHRCLRRARQETAMGKQGGHDELAGIARHASSRERRAEEAERELIEWKKVRFMTSKVGEEFTGYVTGVAQFGLFVELVEHFVEGLVHIESMVDDYYHFVEKQYQLHGENSGKIYRLGDNVRVQLVRVDREYRRMELGLVEMFEHAKTTKNGPSMFARRRRKRRRVQASSTSGRRQQ